MVHITIPFIESIQKTCKDLGRDINLSSFSFKSSLRETTPTAYFQIDYNAESPDLFNLWIGSEFSINSLKIPKTDEEKEEYEKDKSAFTKKLASLSVEALEEAVVQAKSSLRVKCTGEFAFYQNNAIRDCWVSKYTDEILNDTLDANSVMKDYPRDIQKSDNATTIYRTLGESDLDFIEESVSPNFTVQWGRPLFFIGLDGVIHYTSVNTLINAKTKAHYIIKVPGGSQDVSLIKDWLDGKLKSLTEEEPVTLSPDSVNLLLGKDRNYKSLKNTVFYTKNELGAGTTTQTSFSPCAEEESYYPVIKNFLKFVDSFESFTMQNRPTENILFEAKNNLNTEENIITQVLEFSKIDEMDQVIQAGDTITLLNKNPFSVYNGNYIVESVEYNLSEEGAFTMKLTLIRPFLDTTWQDNLDTLKDIEGFSDNFPYLPPLQKNNLYKI